MVWSLWYSKLHEEKNPNSVDYQHQTNQNKEMSLFVDCRFRNLSFISEHLGILSKTTHLMCFGVWLWSGPWSGGLYLFEFYISAGTDSASTFISCCRYKKLGPRLKRSVLECQETHITLLETGLHLQRNHHTEELCLTLMCELSVLSTLAFLPIHINVSRNIHELPSPRDHKAIFSLFHFSSHHAEYYMHEAKRLKHRADAMVC